MMRVALNSMTMAVTQMSDGQADALRRIDQHGSAAVDTRLSGRRRTDMPGPSCRDWMHEGLAIQRWRR